MKWTDFLDSEGWLMAPENGPVVEPDYVSAWVQPDGAFRFVDECNHITVARNLVPLNIDNPDDYLLDAGWVKLSIERWNGRPDIFNIYAHQRIRQAQVNTIWDFFMTTPAPMREKVLARIQRYIPDFGKVD
jgi:hypothetical protein